MESNSNLDNRFNATNNFLVEHNNVNNEVIKMSKLKSFLSGKKTFIGIIAGAVYSVLIAQGLVEDNQVVWTAILTWTGISFRLAISK